MNKKHEIQWKTLTLITLICLGVGGLSAFASGDIGETFKSLPKPPLTPPSAVFPVVWTVLYILMGISAYLVFVSRSRKKETALLAFAVQLIINFFWSPIFFNLGQYGFAFFWLLALIIAVVIMKLLFRQISKAAAFLQIPYLVWLIFAAYINYGVWQLSLS